MDSTPLEKLNKANDDYHEAVHEILLDEDFKDVTVKAEFAGAAHNVFSAMEQAAKIAAEYYEGG